MSIQYGFAMRCFARKQRTAAWKSTIPALAAVLALLLSLGDVDAHFTPLQTDRRLSSAIDRALQEEVGRGFSGAVLVSRAASKILDQAYGSVRRVPVRTDTRFWIASGAKQFTSASILKCEEKGWLRLDEPIAKFFPSAPADKRTITVKQLLAHLSGLGQSYASEGAADRETAVQRMLDEQLIDVPGRKFHYSNSNYQLAVAIVEVASNRSYRDFVADQLWRPAGLRDSGFSGDRGARSVAETREATPARLARSSWGGEGVYSTTHDLLKWYLALRAGRVLAPSSLRQLFTGVTPIGEGEAALGWFIGRTDNKAMRIFTRGNEDFGPNGLVYAYPDTETVIIVLTHAGQAHSALSWSRLAHDKIEKLMLL